MKKDLFEGAGQKRPLVVDHWEIRDVREDVPSKRQRSSNEIVEPSFATLNSAQETRTLPRAIDFRSNLLFQSDLSLSQMDPISLNSNSGRLDMTFDTSEMDVEHVAVEGDLLQSPSQLIQTGQERQRTGPTVDCQHLIGTVFEYALPEDGATKVSNSSCNGIEMGHQEIGASEKRENFTFGCRSFFDHSVFY